MTDRPAWFLDVDGVINAVTTRGKQPPADAAGWHNWIDIQVAGYRIVAARAVLDFLREVHEDRTADIMWLTTWEDWPHLDAILTDLAPALDLPDWPIAGRHGDFPNAPWWKAPHVDRWSHQHPGRPIVWTDDHLSWYRPTRLWVTQSPHILGISPNPEIGLMPTHLNKISRFLQHDLPATG
jgi:hypothetical protein